MSGRCRALVLMLGATVLSSGVVAFGAQRSGPKPAPDPALGDGGVSAFYVWDQEVPSTPGKLLRQEPVPDHLVLTNAEKGLRVLYTATNGIDGKTTVAVSGAIYFPKGPVPAGGWPVVAWAHGTTGVADVCAPSWMPRGKRDTDYLNAWLAQGYAVVASDYQGLGTPGGHPWLSVRPEGWSVLDSVRSALTAFPELENAVVIVGQSQGSHAALSAAGLAMTYAPTLRIKGTVATGVAGGPQWRASRRTSTFLFMVLHKFQALDPAFQPSDYLTDAGKRGFAAAITSCPLPGDPTIPFDDVLKVMPDRAKTAGHGGISDAALCSAGIYRDRPRGHGRGAGIPVRHRRGSMSRRVERRDPLLSRSGSWRDGQRLAHRFGAVRQEALCRATSLRELCDVEGAANHQIASQLDSAAVVVG